MFKIQNMVTDAVYKFGKNIYGKFDNTQGWIFDGPKYRSYPITALIIIAPVIIFTYILDKY